MNGTDETTDRRSEVRRGEPLVFRLRRIIEKVHDNQLTDGAGRIIPNLHILTAEEFSIINEYFPEGVVFMPDAEYRSRVLGDPCSLQTGVVSIRKQYDNLMMRVRIHTRLGVRCTEHQH